MSVGGGGGGAKVVRSLTMQNILFLELLLNLAPKTFCITE